MKSVFSITFTLLSCLGWQNAWAYRNTPPVVSAAVFTAAHSDDLSSFQEQLGRSALCNWGDEAGMQAIRRHFPERRQLNFDINREHGEHLSRARYVGYWSYYVETHGLKVLDKNSGTLLAEGEIECNFGMEGTRHSRDLNLPVDEYMMKSCKLVLLEARSFEHPSSGQCSIFRQSLED